MSNADTHVLTIRVTEQDAELIQQAAEKDQRSVNNWCATRLIRAALRETATTETKRETPKPKGKRRE